MNSERYNDKKNCFYPLQLFIIIFIFFGAFAACEGPTGPDGSQGPSGESGPEGAVGPAGEDGSTIHAGEGTPDSELGEFGDYYLDLETGILYGPKSEEDGWSQSINLTGPAGADGSQIYAGEGSPDESFGETGDFYLDTESYDLYGPKSGDGWGTPINLRGPEGPQGEQGPEGEQGEPGEDGNANVSLYILDGFDFSESNRAQYYIDAVDSEEEVIESVWQVYLVRDTGLIIHVPGPGVDGASEYRVFHQWADWLSSLRLDIVLYEGNGEEYDAVHLFQIEASSVNNDLDYSDYQEVINHHQPEEAYRIN
jgi:hypothetical protein